MGLVGFASDLHFPDERMFLFGRLLDKASLDGLVLAGDFLDFVNDRGLGKLLRLLDRHGPSRIVAVLGNHEHYLSRNMLRRGLDSLTARVRVVERLIGAGIPVLDELDEPVVIGGFYVAGCVGWYDYSLGPPGYSVGDFESCNPFGVPLRLLELCDLYRRREYCPPWWRRDCLYVRLPFPHGEYVGKCVERVSRQLESAGEPVVVVYHHVPRRELLEYSGVVGDFDFAYAGSVRLDWPVRRRGVGLVVYGHVHDRSVARIREVDGVVYGNAYPWYRGSRGLLVVESRRGVARPEIVGF